MKGKICQRDVVEKVRHLLREAEFKFERNFSNLDHDIVRLRNILADGGVHVESVIVSPKSGVVIQTPKLYIDVPVGAGRNALLKRIYEILSDRPKQSDPPKLAEFLLTMLLKPPHLDGVTGDLNERFASECRNLGQRRAVRLYWARTLRSLWPLLRRAVGKAVKWGAVIEAARRLF